MLHTLPEPQREVWPRLARARDLGFVLYGGTAIALRLGHRVSVDFDLFTDGPLRPQELAWALDLLGGGRVTRQREDTYSVEIATGTTAGAPVQLSFFGNISFGRVGLPQLTEDRVMQVASLEDLMATKLKVLLQRAESKDYLDVIAMLDAGADLASGLGAALTLFGSAFQPSEALKALAFFEDGDLHKLDAGERTTLIRAVEAVSVLPQVPMLSRSLAA
jgi:hypothetical protein